jgi:hypothetical protein
MESITYVKEIMLNFILFYFILFCGIIFCFGFVVFSNIINSDKVEQLAEGDIREGVKEVNVSF